MKWLVPKSEKLVSFLQGRLGSYSGKTIRKLLEANLCRINGQIERFGSSVVKGGDVVELSPSWKSVLTPQLTNSETLYENNAFKIVNKPAGVVCKDGSFGEKLYLVHRLDKDTTGLLILAKSPAARDELMDLFEKREISKQYLALVDGIPKEDGGTRKSLLSKKGSYQGQTIWGSGQKGLTAITHWKKLASGGNASLLLCEPVTGRTHQIRVHMAEMGHPILVDRQYATTFRSKLFVKRPLLHAFRLCFQYKGEEIDLKAPLFLDIREGLRGSRIDVRHLDQFSPASPASLPCAFRAPCADEISS